MDGVNKRAFLMAGKWKRLYPVDGKLLTSKLRSGNPAWSLILLLTILLKTKPLMGHC